MFRVALLLMLLIAMMALISSARGGLYRWVDDEGNVHYTDTLPPSQVTKGHTEISERGVRVKIVPPVKTLEELEKELETEKEGERLRAQQERLIEQQEANDRMLLQTFRSEDDIVMARDGKLAAIDVVIQVTKSSIRSQQVGLAGMRAAAANLERVGKPVPNSLADGIAKTERSIRAADASIVEREAQKEEIRASFAQDLARFRQLKGPNAPSTRVKDPQAPLSGGE